MQPFSEDLRGRIVTVYEETTLSYPQVADRFQVSERSVRRFVKQRRETGAVTPKPSGQGHQPKLDEEEVTILAIVVTTQIDASQDELRAFLAEETGTRVSQPTICRTLQRAGITRKKNETGQGAATGRCQNGPAALHGRRKNPSGGRHHCGG